MNCATGHVVATTDSLTPEQRHKYTLLPGWLRRDVKKALDGKRETTIDLTADTPLARFARAPGARRGEADTSRSHAAPERWRNLLMPIHKWMRRATAESAQTKKPSGKTKANTPDAYDGRANTNANTPPDKPSAYDGPGTVIETN